MILFGLARDLGISLSGIWVLMLVYENTELPMCKLTEALAVSPAAMTGIIDVLERGGKVRRVPKPGDRRSHLIRLTENTREKMDLLTPEAA